MRAEGKKARIKIAATQPRMAWLWLEQIWKGLMERTSWRGDGHGWKGRKLELGTRNERETTRPLKIGVVVALKNSAPNSAAAVTTAAMATPESETLRPAGRRS